jgi:hypothetical protein
MRFFNRLALHNKLAWSLSVVILPLSIVASGQAPHVLTHAEKNRVDGLRAFSYYDTQTKAWVVGGSAFTISVGDSIASLPLKAELQLKHGSM